MVRIGKLDAVQAVSVMAVAALALMSSLLAVDAKVISTPYDCYVVFGKIRRCYNGRSNDFTRCFISRKATGDQTDYQPRSMEQSYNFGTSEATVQKIDGGSERVSVATFPGFCEIN